jgi:hypothetical protein
MVGADGAIHLDEPQGVQANAPVIIEQTPELVPPSVVPPGAAPGMSWQSPMAATIQPYGACSVPFVPCAPVCVPCVEQPLPIKYSIFGEFLFLQPRGVDIVHAQQQDGIGGAGTVPFGDLGITDFHYEPGVRVGGDMAVSCNTSIAGSYTWFESNARSRVEAPIVPGGGGSIGSLVHHPGAAITASPGPVDARSVLDFQLADVEYRARLLQGPRSWVNGGLGGRYARLEQEFGQVGIFSGGQAGEIMTQADVDFDGGGPKLALDGGRNIGDRGFSLYARTSVSPIVGEFESGYSLRNNTTGTQLALVNWNDDRVMTILDYEAGLAWTGPRRRWRFAAGYTVAHWFNAVTTGSFINAVQTSDFTDVSDTITFDGLVARVEHLW